MHIQESKLETELKKLRKLGKGKEFVSKPLFLRFYYSGEWKVDSPREFT